MSKFHIGDSVLTYVERGVAKEGDCGRIDAIHPKTNSYIVGFYATEDACIGSYEFYEDELSLLDEKPSPTPFHKGDIVETLKEQCGIEKGRKGEIVDIFPSTQGAAVHLENSPYILPYGFQELKLVQAHSHIETNSPIKS